MRGQSALFFQRLIMDQKNLRRLTAFEVCPSGKSFKNWGVCLDKGVCPHSHGDNSILRKVD